MKLMKNLVKKVLHRLLRTKTSIGSNVKSEHHKNKMFQTTLTLPNYSGEE